MKGKKLTLVIVKDNERGDFIASYKEYPDAGSIGRTKKEAKKLLDELMPVVEKRQSERANSA